MAGLVDDPRQFLLSDTCPSNLHISDIEHGAIITEEDWLTSTSIDEGDVHTRKCILQLMGVASSSDHRYLIVTDTGQVRADGLPTDSGTFFDVIYWFTNEFKAYQLVCRGGRCKGYIVYMEDRSQLTAKPYCPRIDDNRSMMFNLPPKGSNGSLRQIVSCSGQCVRFDDNGAYISPTTAINNDSVTDSGTADIDPYYFEPQKVKQFKVTSV